MKLPLLKLICAWMAFVTCTATAQTNIKKAFDAIIDNSIVTENHSLEMDPSTGEKVSQMDYYEFKMPADKFGIIKNAVGAFDKDKHLCFGLFSGNDRQPSSPWSLAVGDGQRSVNILTYGGEYIYALFSAPKEEDPNGIYRYAHGLSYRQKNDSIYGILATTYALTLKARQDINEKKKLKKSFQLSEDVLKSFNNKDFNLNDLSALMKQDSWFDTLMTYIQGLESETIATQRSLATKIYKHTANIKSAKDVTEQDRTTAIRILSDLINTPLDSVVKNLLSSALQNL
ncbi:MAG: hypothetical protein K1W14_04545 [Muribaculaceae bacterium]